MAKRPTDDHWGKWLIARAKFIGFRFQRDLAKAVGVTPEHMSRWAGMPQAPTHMRRGHDDALARALKLDRNTLFNWWTELYPEDVPTTETPPDADVPWNADVPEAEDLRAEIEKLLLLLGKDDLAPVLVFAADIVRKRQLEFEIKLDDSLRRLKVGPYAPDRRVR